MSDKILQEINDCGVDRISVSLDGTQQVHDSIRGAGSFEKSIRNLDKILTLCTPARSLDVRINTVILNANIECLNDLFDLAKQRKIMLNLMPFTLWDGTFANQDQGYASRLVSAMLGDSRPPSIITADSCPLETKKKKEGVLFNPDKFMDLMEGYYGHPLHTQRKCKAGAYYLNIQGNGEVFLCDQQVVESPGNIRKKSLKDIWYSENFVTTRKQMAGCDKCMMNCMYTPTVWELSKDFLFYPMLRKTGIARFL